MSKEVDSLLDDLWFVQNEYEKLERRINRRERIASECRKLQEENKLLKLQIENLKISLSSVSSSYTSER